MAKLLAYYSLCPINNIDDFLGLSRDVDPGCVINTLGRNIILVVKLSNQRQVRSWTVLDRLSSKVVYDFKSERYVAVFAGHYLRCWERDRPDVNMVKKIKLYRTVLDLFTLANGETLVLYNDGTCESLGSALETKNQDKKDPDAIVSNANVDLLTHSIKDVQVFSLENGSSLLTYFVRREEDGSIELNYALLNQKDLKVYKTYEKVKLERIGGETKLVGCCIVDGSDGPSLISVWSDSRVFYLQLRLGQSPRRDEGVGNFIHIIQTIDVHQPLSLTSIGKDYIAMYAGNTNKDGATLALFNVQVKVFQAKQYFKVYFRASRFWIIENNILLAFGQTLAVVPYRISKEQLSDMIGSQCSSHDQLHTIDDESLNEEGEFFDGYTYAGSLPPIEEQCIEEDADGAENDADREEMPVYHRLNSQQEFDTMLRKAYQSSPFPIDVIVDDTLPDDTIQLKLFNNADNTVGPLVFDQKFETIAEEMEMGGCSELEICCKLVPSLIQANLPVELAKCLKRYSVISERMIVKAVDYAIGLSEEPLNESQSNGYVADETTAPDEFGTEPLPNQDVFADAQYAHSSRRDLLNIVLSCSFDQTTMVAFVRAELSLGKTMKLLQHLELLLVDPMATLSETLHSGDIFDSDGKTVEWIMILLDAHYQQFVLSKDAIIWEQIKRLMRVVDKHIESLRELKCLIPKMVQLMETKNQDKKTGRKELYSIEKIELY